MTYDSEDSKTLVCPFECWGFEQHCVYLCGYIFVLTEKKTSSVYTLNQIKGRALADIHFPIRLIFLHVKFLTGCSHLESVNSYTIGDVKDVLKNAFYVLF